MTRHAAQAGVPVVAGDVGKRVDDIRPSGHDLAEGVDRAGPDIGVVMVQQLECPRHEQLLAGTALVLLAAVTRQCVQRTLQDSGVVIIQGSDEVDESGFVGEMVEDRRTQTTDDRLRVVHAAPHGGQGWLTRLAQVDLGPSAPL